MKADITSVRKNKRLAQAVDEFPNQLKTSAEAGVRQNEHSQ